MEEEEWEKIILDRNNPPTKVPLSADIKNLPELRSLRNLIMEGKQEI